MGMFANSRQVAKQRRAVQTFERIERDLPANMSRRTKTVVQSETVHGPDVQYLTNKFAEANNHISELSKSGLRKSIRISYWQGVRDVSMEMLDHSLGKGWRK